MEEYGENLASIRYSFRSLVVLDDFKTGKPISAAVGNHIYISAEKATAVVKLPMAKYGEDRVEDGERLSAEKPIEQLAAFQNEICYVSGGSVYTLASKLLLKADMLHVLELPVRVGGRVLTALCRTDGKFYAVDDAAGVEELVDKDKKPCNLGDLLSVCAGVRDGELVLIVGVAGGRFAAFAVRGFAELAELGSFAADGACLGLLAGKALCLHENALKLIDPLSGAVVASCADEVFSASIFPLLPRPGCEQCVAINTSEIRILDQNLQQAQVIELSRFAAPACIQIPEIGRNFEPDAIAVCRHLASALYEPRLKSDIFRPVDCAIRGCKTATAPGGSQAAESLDVFKRSDYCYVQLTAGFEMNVAALHYVSIADVSRSDGKSFKFGFGSTAERASERSEFCADAGAKTEQKALSAGPPLLQAPAFSFYSQPAVSAAPKQTGWPGAEYSGLAASQAQSVVNLTYQHSTPPNVALNALPNVILNAPPELPLDRSPESGAQAQVGAFPGLANQTGQASQQYAGSLAQNAGADDESRQTYEAPPVALDTVVVSEKSKTELDTTKKCFNSFVCILNALAPEAPQARISYDYGCGFDVHIAKHCKRAHKLLREQLFMETAPYFDTAQYDLRCDGALILKGSELQRLRQARRQLLHLCQSQQISYQAAQQAGYLSADELDFSGEGQLCRFLRVAQQFKRVKLEHIAHVAKSLYKRLK